MIHDIDETLRALVKRDVLNGSGAEISFEAPTTEWASKRTVPTVNCYLYDIREDTSRRDVFPIDVKDDTGKVVERKMPPRRFRLAYLLTAWTQRPEDEHRLLSDLLRCFLQSEVLPGELLSGSMAGNTGRVLSFIAQPEPDRAISDLWSALGGELKPSLDLLIIAPFDVGRATPAAPPVTETPRFSVARPEAEPEQPQAGRKKKPAAAAAAPAPPAPPALPDETVRVGAADSPGRVFRVHGMPRRK